MLRGLYESAMGMRARQTIQDVTANNLANVNSTRFFSARWSLCRAALPSPRKKRAANASPFATPYITTPVATQDTTPGHAEAN